MRLAFSSQAACFDYSYQHISDSGKNKIFMDMREEETDSQQPAEKLGLWLIQGLGWLFVTGQLGDQDEDSEAGH